LVIYILHPREHCKHRWRNYLQPKSVVGEATFLNRCYEDEPQKEQEKMRGEREEGRRCTPLVQGGRIGMVGGGGGGGSEDASPFAGELLQPGRFLTERRAFRRGTPLLRH
jgi:hypothetical protein